MKPTIGRIVHYTSNHAGRPTAQAAIITEVTPLGVGLPADRAVATERDFVVSLYVFYKDGNSNRHGVEFTTEAPGTVAAIGKWCWPPRDA